MRSAAVIAAALAICLAGPAAAGPKAPIDPDQARADATLLRDEAAAIEALRQRLRDQVGAQGGMLVIEESVGGVPSVTVFPATVPWSVECDDTGLSVTFGSGTGDTDNGIAVQLTTAAVPVALCRRLAPAIGETVMALSRGQ